MRTVPDVVWASAVMGTPANAELLQQAGFEVEGLRVNDLVLAVEAESDGAAQTALDMAQQAIRASEPAPDASPAATRVPRDVTEAAAELGDANLALVSVPGPYAALEAHKALAAGLHVLLFSDNVPLSDEVVLKRRAAEHGLLVMGPGAGTAMFGGVGLGFANVVRRGPVRVIAAAGTGAQEVMALLHRWGSGVSEVIGVGGRDLSREVQATVTRMAIEADGDHVFLVVSKPPDPDVAASVLQALDGRRAVCAFIGVDGFAHIPEGVRVASTLDQAVIDTLDLLGHDLPDPGAGLRAVADRAVSTLGPDRRAVRGLFSGGTLCYEAMVVMSRRLGPIHSNTPLQEDMALPAPDGAHICLDLGEEEYTRGRPHPMIDPLARADELQRACADPTTAVVLVDVVLGHGSHPDPAGALAEMLDRAGSREDGPVVVAHVVGTELDPQSAPEQQARLEQAGCLVAPTGARAALLAAAIATRRPEIAEEVP
jgi:FdrA protein